MYIHVFTFACMYCVYTCMYISGYVHTCMYISRLYISRCTRAGTSTCYSIWHLDMYTLHTHVYGMLSGFQMPGDSEAAVQIFERPPVWLARGGGGWLDDSINQRRFRADVEEAAASLAGCQPEWAFRSSTWSSGARRPGGRSRRDGAKASRSTDSQIQKSCGPFKVLKRQKFKIQARLCHHLDSQVANLRITYDVLRTSRSNLQYRTIPMWPTIWPTIS